MKKTARKLTLSTETVRVLQSDELGLVNGGALILPPSTTIPASQVAGGCKTIGTVICNYNSLACGYGF